MTRTTAHPAAVPGAWPGAGARQRRQRRPAGRDDLWSPSATAVQCAVVSAALGLVVGFLAPHGNDYAAHAWQLRLFETRGPLAWTSDWYAGQYLFWTYSVLTYPLASLLGFALLGAVSVAVAAGSAALLLGRVWGRAANPAAWVFALLWPGYLLSSDFPFTLGAALALVALVLLQSRRRWRLAAFVPVALACLAASPLAFAGMALVVVALALSGRLHACRLVVSLATVAGGGLCEAIIWRIFPFNGRYPFWGPDYFSALAFTLVAAVLAWRIPRRREALTLAGLYAVGCAVLFLVPTAVGANIVRVQYPALAIMVLLAALRRWRPRSLCVVAVALSAVWSFEPQVGPPLFESQATAAAAKRSYWAPAISYLESHRNPDQRVEAVDVANHWPALYLAEAGIPLARGWYRQDDFPLNAFLYHHFSPAAYVNWLHRLGIAYVVVSTATPDFSAAEEARIVRDGRAGLVLVESSPTVDVYRVPHPAPMLSGPGHPRVLAAGQESFLIAFSRPGRYSMDERWSPYWSAPGVCAQRRPDGLMTLVVSRPGTTRFAFSITGSRLLSAFVHPEGTKCR